MKKIKLFISLSILLLFIMPLYSEEISFIAQVNKNTLPLNDTLIYSLTISAEGAKLPEPEKPLFNDFTQYSSGKSQNMSIINGKMSRSITYDYTLAPKSIGKFTIPAAKVNYKNKTYYTEPVEIEVTQAQSRQTATVSSGGGQSSSPARSQQRQGKIFVNASVNKKTVYENEKLIYKFKFYSNADLLSNPEYFAPDFTGFWNDGSQPSSKYETIEGETYSVSEIETYLYPLESGDKIIPPAKLRVAISDFSSSDSYSSIFDAFFGADRRQVKILETDPVNIKVIPLPKENMPEDFSGAIGNFKISASLDKETAETNEPITLIVQVKGKGNMKSITGININTDSSFRKYDTIVSQTKEDMKEFKTILIPSQPGDKIIPEIKISFFDPDKKTYSSDQTSPIEINITGEPVYDEKDTDYKEASMKVNRDIRYNKTIKNISKSKGYLIKNKYLYIILFPFILIFIIAFAYRSASGKIKESISNMKTRSFSAIQKHINAAESCISKNEAEKFGLEINKILSKTFKAAFSIDMDDLSSRELLNLLQKENISQDTLKEIEKVLETLNFYRFASVKADEKMMQDLLNKVKNIVNEIRK